jgi:hypothetical protein
MQWISSERRLRLCGHAIKNVQAAGLVSLVRDDTAVSEAEMDGETFPSKWVVTAWQRSDLCGIARDPRWQPPRVKLGSKTWTDDYSNLLGIIKWR